MQLETLTIDRSLTGQPLTLGRFSPGLTFLYGETSSGKSSTLAMIRQSLFSVSPAENPISGELQIRHRGQKLSLRRAHGLSSHLDIRAIEPSATYPVVPTERELRSHLDRNLYRTLFQLDCHDPGDQAARLATTLQDLFDLSADSQWRRDDAHQRRSRVEQLRRQQAALETEVDECLTRRQRQLERHQSHTDQARQRLAELDRLIVETRARLAPLNSESPRDQVAQVSDEIDALRAVIQRADDQPAQRHLEVNQDFLVLLYEHLDDLDRQIHSWRHTQSDIQSHRLRLRDEMQQWSEMALDTETHPYHLVRKLLIALENKIDQAERDAQNWAGAGGARVDTEQMTKSLGNLCQSMRDDVYGMCDELSHQFKHLKHKSAANELKQLRQYYNVIGENLEQLIHRRTTLVRRIRERDPAGAEAIMRADTGFCHCAQQDGYLAARTRFVGPMVAMESTATKPDVSAERSRLHELEAELHRRQQNHATLNAEMTLLNADLKRWSRERSELAETIDAEDGFSLTASDAELAGKQRELAALEQQLESLETRRVDLRHPLLRRASQWIRQISGGQLERIELVRSHESEPAEWVLADTAGHPITYADLSRGHRDQVCLVLMLAAGEQLRQQNGLSLPALIDNPFSSIEQELITPTLTWLAERGQAGQQIILGTQHRFLADRVPGVTVLSLPEPPSAGVSPTPSSPRVIQFGDAPWTAERESDAVAFDSVEPRPYPLSKYPHSHGPDSGPAPRIYPLNVGDSAPLTYRPDQFDPGEDWGSSAVTPVSVDAIADPIDYLPAYRGETLLDRTGLFEISHLRRLADERLATIDDLLYLDPARIESMAISTELIDRWQAQLWLMMHVPTLRADDARVLVACGITEPQQLATSYVHQIEERIVRFLGTTSGRRGGFSDLNISRERIASWLRGLETTRDRWANRRRPQADTPPTAQPDPAEAEQVRARAFSAAPRTATMSDHAPLQPRPPRMHSQSVTAGPEQLVSRQNRSATTVGQRATDSLTNRTEAPAAKRSKPKATRQTGGVRKPQSGSPTLKFHLDLGDHIEAAPAIGPKTAQRLEEIGVVSVKDFLDQTAERMAKQLNYKRLNANLLRRWQQQARLVCRIPNLRGHDAQLLVACDITEPETLATLQPRQLLDAVRPVAESKEGVRMLRGGKQPDLNEITDWIGWASENRSLHAA